MQFLVYLTILMVSISTVLLEVHWLTSPPPQPRPAVQAANTPAPAPKVEGPNAALSPIYPKKPEPGESTANAQQPATSQQQAQQTQAPAAAAATTETTGMATRTEDNKQAIAAPDSAAPTRTAAQTPAATGGVSSNLCDADACAGAYRSFRASDCTYQPFFGERRLCTKAPIAAGGAAREPSPEQAAPRRSTRDIGLRAQEVERRAKLFRDSEDDDDGRVEIHDSDRDEPSPFLFGRARRW